MAQLTTEVFTNPVTTHPTITNAGGINASATSVALSDASSHPNPGTNQQYRVKIDDEICWVTARSGNTLTIARGKEGTTAASHANGVDVVHLLTAEALLVHAVHLNPLPRLNKMLAWTFDPVAVGSSTAPVGGVIHLGKIPIPVSMTITNILLYVITAASANLGASYVGLYDSSGNQLRISADIQTSLESTGKKTLALTSAIAVTGGPDVSVYAAILCPTGATTFPALGRAGGGTVGMANVGMVAADGFRAGTSGSGLTTLPASFTVSGMGETHPYWFGLN